MGEQTRIEWADHTFNPWEGCQAVSPECDHCYAEERDNRFTGGAHWGPHAPRRRTSAANWQKPIRWNRQADAFEAEHGRRQRVFCASLGDVFDNAVPEAWRADLWALIDQTPRLDWLLLTKRPQNIARMLPPRWGDGWENVWLGTSAGTQATADKNVPALLSVPAAVHFLSAEPLLGPLDLEAIMTVDAGICALSGIRSDGIGPSGFSTGPNIGWVIAGGESGPKARPMHPDWVRSLRDQCASAGVPFFFKQWGEWGVFEGHPGEALKAGAVTVWPNGITGHGTSDHGGPGLKMVRLGKGTTGRVLDGRTHDEVPS